MFDAKFLILPIVGALIGWFTNFLAVKMLFRPRRPVRLLGLTIQGLVPRRRTEIALSIGDVVEQELVSHEDIHAALSNPDFLEGLRRPLEEKVDSFLHERVVRDNPLLRAMMSTAAAVKMKDRIVSEIMASLPSLVEGFGKELKERLRFRELVVSKIEAFEMERLEKLVTDIASRELKAIEILGGVLGFVIGLVQMLLLLWV